MKIGKKTKKKGQLITAAEGKVLIRKSDQQLFGSQITLGKRFYENGKILETPVVETPDDYEEIDEPLITDFEPLALDIDSVIVEVMAEEEEKPVENKSQEESDPVAREEKPKIVITGQDIIDMQDKLKKIMSLLSPDQLEELQSSNKSLE